MRAIPRHEVQIEVRDRPDRLFVDPKRPPTMVAVNLNGTTAADLVDALHRALDVPQTPDHTEESGWYTSYSIEHSATIGDGSGGRMKVRLQRRTPGGLVSLWALSPCLASLWHPKNHGNECNLATFLKLFGRRSIFSRQYGAAYAQAVDSAWKPRREHEDQLLDAFRLLSPDAQRLVLGAVISGVPERVLLPVAPSPVITIEKRRPRLLAGVQNQNSRYPGIRG